jgi:hypothetical protein
MPWKSAATGSYWRSPVHVRSGRRMAFCKAPGRSAWLKQCGRLSRCNAGGWPNGQRSSAVFAGYTPASRHAPSTCDRSCWARCLRNPWRLPMSAHDHPRTKKSKTMRHWISGLDNFEKIGTCEGNVTRFLRTAALNRRKSRPLMSSEPASAKRGERSRTRSSAMIIPAAPPRASPSSNPYDDQG